MKSTRLSDIEIQNELQPGDLGYVVYLHGKLYGAEYDFGIGFESYVAKGLHEFCEKYDPKTNRVWVCRHDGVMIGFLLLMNRGDAAQLRYFLIEPSYRGIGLGHKLMDLFMEFVNSCNYKSSYLLTTAQLSAAAHLYTSRGFLLVEEKGSMAFGKAVVEQRYELVL
jgi:N-acetylglutamate synthase-like GNAT family acetyltransferase